MGGRSRRRWVAGLLGLVGGEPDHGSTDRPLSLTTGAPDFIQLVPADPADCVAHELRWPTEQWVIGSVCLCFAWLYGLNRYFCGDRCRNELVDYWDIDRQEDQGGHNDERVRCPCAARTLMHENTVESHPEGWPQGRSLLSAA